MTNKQVCQQIQSKEIIMLSSGVLGELSLGIKVIMESLIHVRDNDSYMKISTYVVNKTSIIGKHALRNIPLNPSGTNTLSEGIVE